MTVRKAETFQVNNKSEGWKGQVSIIEINAESVERTDSGTWKIMIPSRPLSDDEHAFLARMFPHTKEQISELLAIEVLFGSIVRD